ncbi:uncharacterized protein LOC111248014 isoform X2 [Varroa destructor]|uniref:Uncharacterized protein n=1 Tax=Varroa destructor TaxID=109461 RepID=A0A7M7M7I4_VARDE|nr:uncharacterized protein LOC111248014 isoform X2 [Varroa destructor]
MRSHILSLNSILLCAIFTLFIVKQEAEAFFFGSRNPRQRASECIYCPQRQTLACTGITGPPLQVTRSQANCLTNYCLSSVLGGGQGGAAVPVSTGRKRRHSPEPSNLFAQQISVDTTVLFRENSYRSSNEINRDLLLNGRDHG